MLRPPPVNSPAAQSHVPPKETAHKAPSAFAGMAGPTGHEASRRGALRLLCSMVALAITLPWRRAEAKKVGLALAQVSALSKVGGSATVNIKGQELLLIRDTESTIKALDPMCTHKKCKVFYRAKENDIGCKCHKSKFTLSGVPVSGPAPRPLGRFPAKIKGDKVIIDLG